MFYCGSSEQEVLGPGRRRPVTFCITGTLNATNASERPLPAAAANPVMIIVDQSAELFACVVFYILRRK